MFYYDPVFIHSVQQTIEILGTLAFAVSGIRHAAARHYDWFGGFVCGFVVAIGGGTLRDVMLGVTPFWMTSPMYIVCTFLAQAMVILFARLLRHLDNAWFFFDTLGLALFTIAGIQKTLVCGHPFWVVGLLADDLAARQRGCYCRCGLWHHRDDQNLSCEIPSLTPFAKRRRAKRRDGVVSGRWKQLSQVLLCHLSTMPSFAARSGDAAWSTLLCGVNAGKFAGQHCFFVGQSTGNGCCNVIEKGLSLSRF